MGKQHKVRRAPDSLGMNLWLPLTCRGPGLDVPRAVDHSVLGLPFFHGTKAIPKKRASVRWLSAPGGEARSPMAPLPSKLLGSY